MKRLSSGCPICGNPDIDSLDEFGYVTFEICDCCGAESGYTYGADTTEKRFLELRRAWLCDRGGKWYSTTSGPPNGWNAVDQLRSAGLKATKGDDKSEQASGGNA